MNYVVVLSPEARQDLIDLYEYLADRFSQVNALKYIERIQSWCESLRSFPRRGHAREDIRPGIRVAGFERRVTIAFHVGEETVTILESSMLVARVAAIQVTLKSINEVRSAARWMQRCWHGFRECGTSLSELPPPLQQDYPPG